MNPLALLLTIFAIIAGFVLPRRYAMFPLVSGAILIPPQNGFDVFGINVPVLRLLLLCLLARVVLKNEWGIQRVRMDHWIVIWAVWVTVSYTLLSFEVGALINRIGSVWIDLALTYFLTRTYIRDAVSLKNIILLLLGIIGFLACTTVLEYVWRLNVFSFAGAIEFVQVRGDKLRCQGPFGHPIALGSFGAMGIPLAWGLYKANIIPRSRALMLFVGCLAVTLCSGSSSPIFTLAAAIVAIVAWRVRYHTRKIFWSGVLAAVALEIAMKAHIWWLIPRLNPMGGSAYHRAKLIDHFVANFSDWWLLGTRSNAEWGGGGYMTHDVANHLLRMGTAGGVLAILIFLVTLLLAFKAIGRIVVSPSSSFPETVIAWSLGGVLFAHFVTFIGLSYWDQMRLVLYLHLGIGASVVAICRSGGIPDRSDECEVKTGGRVSANAIV